MPFAIDMCLYRYDQDLISCNSQKDFDYKLNVVMDLLDKGHGLWLVHGGKQTSFDW